MVVGLCTVELYLPDGHSLKAKRQVLSSLKTRLRNHFNVSVAEVGGTVLESRLDRGRGPVATVLVQAGTLQAGKIFVVGSTSGRVRALNSDSGVKLKEAGPSTPVEVIGLLGVPAAGSQFAVVKDERSARPRLHEITWPIAAGKGVFLRTWQVYSIQGGLTLR